MAKGRFSSTSRQDIAVSVPRANNYFGQVNIITNNNGLDYQGQTLTQKFQVQLYDVYPTIHYYHTFCRWENFSDFHWQQQI